MACNDCVAIRKEINAHIVEHKKLGLPVDDLLLCLQIYNRIIEKIGDETKKIIKEHKAEKKAHQRCKSCEG